MSPQGSTLLIMNSLTYISTVDTYMYTESFQPQQLKDTCITDIKAPQLRNVYNSVCGKKDREMSGRD